MATRVIRIAPHQAGKVVGALYLAMGLMFLPIFFFLTFGSEGPDWGWMLGAPIFYGVAGYVMAAIAAALYNWTVPYIGGLEVTLDSIEFPTA